MKKFFGIKGNYKFEYNDIRALMTLLNVILILHFGLTIAWFGFAIALIGIVKDLAVDRRINGLVMHLATLILNLYFILIK